VPPDGCEYDVAPFIQAYLDKTVYKTKPEWAGKLVEAVSPMRLRRLEESDDCNSVGSY